MLARKSLLILANHVLGAFLGLAALFFVGRYMTPTALGMYGFAMGLAGLASIVGSLGFDMAHVKRVSEGRDLGTSLGTFTRIKVALVAAFLLLTVGSAVAWARTRGFQDATTLPVVIVVVCYYAFYLLRTIPLYTFEAFRFTAKAQLMVFFENLVKTPLAILAAVAFALQTGRTLPERDVWKRLLFWMPSGILDSNDRAALALAVAYAAGALTSLVVGLWLLRRHRYPFGRFDPTLARSYAAFAFPFALLSMLQLVTAEVDKVMIGYFWDAAEVGQYYAAQRITTLALIIPSAVAVLFFPLVSQLWASGDRGAVDRGAATAQRLIGLVTLPTVTLLIVFAPEVFHLFLSDAYLPAVPIVRLLSLYVLLVSFSVVPTSIIQGFDRPRAGAAIAIASTLTNVGLNLVLIPTSILGVPLLGRRAVGAALATVIAQGVSLVAFYVVARRLTGHTYVSRSFLRQAGATAVMAAALGSTKGWAAWNGLDRVWEVGAACAVGLALYLLILWALREVSVRDARYLRELFDPTKMVGYIRDEVVPPQRPGS